MSPCPIQGPLQLHRTRSKPCRVNASGRGTVIDIRLQQGRIMRDGSERLLRRVNESHPVRSREKTFAERGNKVTSAC